MNQAMINSAVTMGQLQQQLDTIGDNLANANTTGFKRRDTSFNDLLFQQVDNLSRDEFEMGRDTPNGIRRGSGAGVSQTAVRFEQGSINETGRELDIALTEPGYFFELEPGDDGDRRFTRDGAFYFSPNPEDETENFVVNHQGDYLLDEAGDPVVMSSEYSDFTIYEDGTIEGVLEDGETEDVAQLQLVNITHPQHLESQGENNFVFGDLDAVGLEIDDVLDEAAGTEVFQQGALESSNVDMGREMTSMLEAQRSYQMNSRAADISNQMQEMVSNLR
ncbi:flagellar hook-basal body protein [Salisediminibacterium halotolerans]|uniref:Flagellar basal-body rod protein FlgG n=1 Tax=Salisediminibacterium halotolerans TaxID=517425 RepID=A0A1H9QMI0_9BACI|nr:MULTISPECIES: flagellar hook-basal body protein [Salisediminibacterium]RLJ75778.1 flagellar basal-body rod protein FlgG [Actinophytocola xinjiangensis]RPE89632.1 flagellar basal-body rod protein FlgG [Salisediminibacterium halotolerans]TWG36391.1 flagellar basal-body rod protein FlgG [Salisediminibacterium halotolerans]SER61781.1 flagellar basal-body rod protein FlgG [Salisediminibacterium haloalkalitolerans]GEL07531.1 flagellar hook-basal body complex protein FlhP [Salisediminibacterium ha